MVAMCATSWSQPYLGSPIVGASYSQSPRYSVWPQQPSLSTTPDLFTAIKNFFSGGSSAPTASSSNGTSSYAMGYADPVQLVSGQAGSLSQCPKQLTCNCADQNNALTIDGTTYQNSCGCGVQTKSGTFTITDLKPGGAVGTAGLPPGTPMLCTQPEICSACYIHVGGTTQGTRPGKGCIHLPPALFNSMKNCQSQNIQLTLIGALGGTANGTSTPANSYQIEGIAH
jgi:hypothetical protein